MLFKAKEPVPEGAGALSEQRELDIARLVKLRFVGGGPLNRLTSSGSRVGGRLGNGRFVRRRLVGRGFCGVDLGNGVLQWLQLRLQCSQSVAGVDDRFTMCFEFGVRLFAAA